MQNLDRIISFVKRELDDAGVSEVSACGEFKPSDSGRVLFPGGVYGFFANLSNEEAQVCLNEARNRNSLNCVDESKFKPVLDNWHPIYWGKDRSIGMRPYQHLNNPSGTGSIRLSTYESLRDKDCACIAIVVDDFEKLESYMQDRFPHLLKTTNAVHTAS